MNKETSKPHRSKPKQRARQEWLAVLTNSSLADLEEGLTRLNLEPKYSFLRRPEVGLVMVRGRAGGNGRRFNLGEMTVSRCTVALADGPTGTGYVAGRSRRRAELVALFDALLQDPDRQALIKAKVIRPLRQRQAETEHLQSRKTAATKVDFLTMVRGEDGDAPYRPSSAGL
ncbi:MAG: phosphonate C-P lyase system protein PhnG [Deltaproteobacteria bacterium]|nr:phosphonate C-P lyase system protein PhnG [Deltaproteobacteria bacterium]